MRPGRSRSQEIAGDRSGNEGGPAAVWYGLSLGAFVLALLSKTSTVMLPLLLLGVAAFRRGRITGRDLICTGPFFGLALAFGLMSAWFQKHLALAGQTLAPESFGERLAMAGRAFWFYLGKALLPVHLNLVYPRWKVDASSAGVVPAGAADRRGFSSLLAIPPQLGAAGPAGAGSFCGDVVSGARLL